MLQHPRLRSKEFRYMEKSFARQNKHLGNRGGRRIYDLKIPDMSLKERPA